MRCFRVIVFGPNKKKAWANSSTVLRIILYAYSGIFTLSVCVYSINPFLPSYRTMGVCVCVCVCVCVHVCVCVCVFVHPLLPLQIMTGV